jgi:hypothetical protein
MLPSPLKNLKKPLSLIDSANWAGQAMSTVERAADTIKSKKVFARLTMPENSKLRLQSYTNQINKKRKKHDN